MLTMLLLLLLLPSISKLCLLPGLEPHHQTRAPAARRPCGSPHLTHEAGDDPVEAAALVAKSWLLRDTQLPACRQAVAQAITAIERELGNNHSSNNSGTPADENSCREINLYEAVDTSGGALLEAALLPLNDCSHSSAVI